MQFDRTSLCVEHVSPSLGLYSNYSNSYFRIVKLNTQNLGILIFVQKKKPREKYVLIGQLYFFFKPYFCVLFQNAKEQTFTVYGWVRQVIFSFVNKWFITLNFSKIFYFSLLRNKNMQLEECFSFLPLFLANNNVEESFQTGVLRTKTFNIKGGKFLKKLWCYVGGKVRQDNFRIINRVGSVNKPP